MGVDASDYNASHRAIGRTGIPVQVRLRCSHPSQTALLRPPFWFRRNRHVIDDVLFYTKDQDLAGRLSQESWHATSLASDRTDHGRDEWNQVFNGFSDSGR